MATNSILLSGFGGQGILFAGKQLAKSAMMSDKNVSWLPSYGPEMRGGTASCSVTISDEPVGSPVVTNPDILICFNIPSFDKFEKTIRPGGMMFADSALIDKKSERTDISAYYIPASALASDNDLPGLANVIMLGKLVAVTGLFSYDEFVDHMVESIPASKAALIEKNKKAFHIGYTFE